MSRNRILAPGKAWRPPREEQVRYRQVRSAMLELADPEKAVQQAGFFKTGEGQCAEDDRFLGITVPIIRRLARQFRLLGLADYERLLDSTYNDARLLALLILVWQYQNGDIHLKEKLHRLYLKKRCRVNNWNLVGSSAPNILGAHLVT